MGAPDETFLTFSLAGEDHTLGNAVRFMLNQDPRVVFCGYTVPHPSDNCVNVQVQTTGESAKAVFKDALRNLMDLCTHVNTVFETKMEEYERSMGVGQRTDSMDVDGVQRKGKREAVAKEEEEEEEEDEDEEDEDEDD